MRVAGAEEHGVDAFLGCHFSADFQGLFLVSYDHREELVESCVDDRPVDLGIGVRGVSNEKGRERHGLSFQVAKS